MLTHRVLASDDCLGSCNFIDFTILPVGTTIGLHTHADDEEEYYLILRGQGRMTCDGETFVVKPGDLIRNGPSGTHSLENTGDEPIQLFVFEVSIKR